MSDATMNFITQMFLFIGIVAFAFMGRSALKSVIKQAIIEALNERQARSVEEKP